MPRKAIRKQAIFFCAKARLTFVGTLCKPFRWIFVLENHFDLEPAKAADP
jgi:hypothetical protein